MKIRCVWSDGLSFTVGNIYTFKDKQIISNYRIRCEVIGSTIKDVNASMYAQFEEVEETFQN